MHKQALALILLLSVGFASLTQASLENNVYVVNDTLTITGTVDSETLVSFKIYDSDNALKNSSTQTFNNTLLFTQILNFTEGNYEVQLSDGSKTLYFTFKLKGELLNYHTFLTTDMDSYKYQSTPHKITSYGSIYEGNFTYPLVFSWSKVVYMGNETEGNTDIRYVLIDHDVAGEYNTIYIDDDTNFEIYDDVEDSTGIVEKSRELWNVINETVITYIDSAGFFGAQAIDSPTYAPSDEIHLVIITTNSTDIRVSKDVNVSLVSETGIVATYENATTNSDGYIYINLTAPSVGIYTVFVNDEPQEKILVKNFELFVQVTDVDGNPQKSFRPTGVVNFKITGKTTSSSVTLTSSALKIFQPNGTVSQITLKEDGTIYEGSFNLAGFSQGEYGVEAIGTYNSETQKAKASFSILNAKPNVMAINLEYVDQEIMINSFAPDSNITFLVTLYNISKAVVMDKEPCAGGSCVALYESENLTCNERVQIVKILDEFGKEVTLGDQFVMNVSDAALGMPDIPTGLLNQCMAIITSTTQTGEFKAIIRMNHTLYEGELMVPFSVNKLYAIGDPVDSEGNDFGFFKPDGTVRLNLKVKNLATDAWVNSSQIFDPKLIEVKQVYPSNLDMFDQPGYNKTVANESVDNGILSFTAPSSEGFYEIRFRFNANISDEIVDGEGSAFVSLKKYFIHGMGSEMYAPGENITLSVTVADADSASWGSSCTGCVGLTANISRLRNEQTGKVYDNVQYRSSAITSSDSGLTIIIQTEGMDSGWYSSEFTLYDPEDETTTYMGWGGFELRNFWVDAIPLELGEDGNYTANYEGQYSDFSEVLVGLVIYTHEGPQLPTTASLISFGLDMFEFTLDVPATLDIIGPKTMKDEKSSGLKPIYVVNVSSGATEDEYYRLSIQASYGGSSDIGTVWLEKSSFGASMELYPQERKFKWPIRYSSTEEVLVTFNGYNDTDDHGLDNVTIEDVFSEKTKMPIKFRYGDNYTTVCSASQCNVTFNLTNLVGEYYFDFLITDIFDKEKWSGLPIQIQDYVLAVPELVNAWSWETSDLDSEFELRNSEDRCQNQFGLESDSCPSNTTHLCLEFSDQNINITLNDEKQAGDYYGTALRFENGWDFGRWNTYWDNTQGAFGQFNTYLITNGTHYWIYTDSDFTGIPTNETAIDTFRLNGIEWNLTDIQGSQIEMNAVGSICGHTNIWSQSGEIQYDFIIIAPSNIDDYKDYYFGASSLLEENYGPQDGPQCGANNVNIFAFHNKTHAWVTNISDGGGTVEVNLTAITPQELDGTFLINGSNWQVSNLDVEVLKLRSVDRLFTGHYVNVSKAVGTRLKIGQIDEGSMQEMMDFQIGFDLDNDGEINGSLSFVTLDGTTQGIFDTLGFGLDACNITDYVSISDTRTNRQVGYGDTLTLLSIGSQGQEVILYSDKPGNSPWLGEVPSSGNFKVPVVVMSPNGSASVANVTVDVLRKSSDVGETFVSLPTTSYSEITGVGELEINASLLSTGNYFVGMVANVSGYNSLIKLEDWMWPNVFVRTFFSDTRAGEGIYLEGFSTSNAYKSGWGMFIQDDGVIQRVEENEIEWTPTCGWVEPSDTADGVNHTYEIFKGDYYIYQNEGNASLVWVKEGDCDFSSASWFNLSDTYNFTLGDQTLIMNFLNTTINHTQIGLVGLDTLSNLTKMNDHRELMSVNISGTLIDFIVANESSGICDAFEMDSCGHAVYVSYDGNFTNATKYSVGENFTKTLYVQYVEPWGGRVQIGTFSGDNSSLFVTDRGEDAANLSYKYFDESTNSNDLNGDGSYGNVSMLMFDDWRNNDPSQNAIIVDDDLNLIPWIGVFNSNTTEHDAYDYEIESGAEENWGHLSHSGWDGNLDANSTNWQIPEATENTILLFNQDTQDGVQNMTVLLRVYDFYGAPVVGASVNITKVRKFGFISQLLVEGTDYDVVPILNSTTNKGYAVFKLNSPNWDRGEYWIKFNVTHNGVSDLIDGWMHLGNW